MLSSKLLFIPCLAILVGIPSASAVTLDLTPPPWERWDPPAENNQFATYAVWNFDSDPLGSFSIIPDNNVTIESNPLVCTLCGNSATLPESAAVWRNTGAWEFQLEGIIDVSLTNVIDDRPIKFIRAQITWQGELSSAPKVYVATAFDPSLPGSGIIPLAGGEIIDTDPFGTHTFDDASGSWHSLYLAEIHPNPNNENFDIFVSPNTTIDGIVIDTVSIPEPAAGGLLLFAALAWLTGTRRTQGARRTQSAA